MTDYSALRNEMVRTQIKARGVIDSLVIEAMKKVPRHEFVSEKYKEQSYVDSPLPIGYNQTISQPYIVAYMTELLKINHQSKVLEIGTGCGYQGAVIAEIAKVVYSVEIVPELCELAEKNIRRLRYENIHLRCGDGAGGWQENAPYDAIIVTAAPITVPVKLKKQLNVNARLVIPVGDIEQSIKIITRRTKDNFSEKVDISVRFVPMTGRIQEG